MTQEDVATLDLAQYQWRNRLILIFSEAADDTHYCAMRSELAENAAGISDRDLVVLHILADGESRVGQRTLKGPAVDALRQQFRIEEKAFTLILVGKDGTVKRRAETYVPLVEIFEQIDAMPMRQREIRARGERRGEKR